MPKRKLKQTRQGVLARKRYQRRTLAGPGVRRKRKRGERKKGMKHEKGGWIATALALLPFVLELFED